VATPQQYVGNVNCRRGLIVNSLKAAVLEEVA
jgi:hypothetical protein